MTLQQRTNGGRGTSLALAPGARPVAGYQLVQFLGKGSYGEVWQAVGPGGFAVALKFTWLDGQAAGVELRSLDVMKDVRHPHLLALFGAWVLDECLAVAMELGEQTLLDRFREAQRQGHPGIPRDELLEYLQEAAKGIDHLNGLGVQHRDIKPQNLLLLGGGVKVADFGLAKLLENTVSTNTGRMTPAYAAPEFFSGQTMAQSDQYSLAVTYCHLRGGRLPFEGNPAQMMANNLLAAPDLSMLPEEERPAVARALAKKPEERWPSCRAFAEAVAGRAPVAAPTRRVSVPAPKTDIPVAQPTARATRTVPDTVEAGPRPRRSLFLAACVGGVLALLGGAGLLLSHGRRGGPDPAPAGPSPTAKAEMPAKSPPKDSSRDKPKTNPPSPSTLPHEPPTVAAPAVPTNARDLRNSIGMELVRIDPGTFRMGSPSGEDGRNADEQQHSVSITRPFYLGKYEVTRGQFRRFVEETGYQTDAEATNGNGRRGGSGYDTMTGKWETHRPQFSWRSTGFPQDDTHPVVNVSWNDARAFCQWLSRQEKRPYRLPTEAEWEYACRAGTTTRYASGDDPETLATVANVPDAAARAKFADWATIRASDGYVFTAPVGRFAPNAVWLYDMHGNVWEWCADWYDKDYYTYSPGSDPAGPANGQLRVLRGGSFRDAPRDCRSAARFRVSPTVRSDCIGFRVACVP